MPLGSGEFAYVAGARGRATGQRGTDQHRSAGRGFGDLLLEHLPSLYGRARGLERSNAAADDLVQDTIERALRKFHRFEPGSDLRRWLLAIMQNLFTDRWRERCRTRGQMGELATVVDPEPDAGHLPPCRSELTTVADVRQALAQVAEPLRTTFELRFFERLSYQEVAVRTGVPVATVGTRILRARLRVTSVVDQLEVRGSGARPAVPSDA